MRRVKDSGFYALLAIVMLASFCGILGAQSYSPDEIRAGSEPYFLPPQSAFRVNTKEIQVEVVVRDSKGLPIGGLGQDQFQLLDKGQVRKLSAFVAEVGPSAAPLSAYPKPSATAMTNTRTPDTTQASARPRFVAIFFDDTHILPGDFSHVQIAAERFVKEDPSRVDRFGIFTASSATTLEFTADRDKLIQTLEAMRARPMTEGSQAGQCPHITSYQAHQIVAGDLTALQAAFLEAQECLNDGTEIYTSVVKPRAAQTNPEVLNKPASQKDPALQQVRFEASEIWQHTQMISQMTFAGIRNALESLGRTAGDRMLLIASPGFLSEDMEPEIDAAIAEALRSDTVIDAIDAKGLYLETPGRPIDQPSTTATEKIERTLNYEATTRGEVPQADTAAVTNLAIGTGGLFFRDNNDLNYGLYAVGVVPAFSYLLSFSADDVHADGSYHSLKVKVDRPNTYPEYRPGYYAPSNAAAAAGATSETKAPGSKLDQAVRSPDEVEEIPAIFTPKVGKSAKGAPEISVVTHVSLQPLQFENRNGRQVQRLDFVIALFDVQGNFVAGRHGEFALALKPESLKRLEATGISGTLTLEAPAGSYRLRTVVQEAVSGKIAASSQDVEIQ